MRASQHAARRMNERGITLAEVEHVVQNPHTTYASPEGKPCYVGEVNGRSIKVVVAPDDPKLIVSVWVQGGT